MRPVLAILLTLICLTPCPAQSAGTAPPNLHKAEWWYSHLIGDLFPFWLHPDAWGEPWGNFPTTRLR